MSGPRVVVGHDAEAIREAALRVAREVGCEAIGVADGESVRTLLGWTPAPAALVVDVGLPRVLGTELCDEIRTRGLPTRVVLIASVYSRTAYKRRPSTLYGADDYVEVHHIPDLLAAKLARLVPAPRPAPARDAHAAAGLSAAEREEAERLRRAAEARLAFAGDGRGGDGAEARARERARRLARIIVADVLLYNGGALEEGLAAGDLAGRLAGDLASGRALFGDRVPAEIAGLEDYIGEALAALADPRRGEPA